MQTLGIVLIVLGFISTRMGKLIGAALVDAGKADGWTKPRKNALVFNGFMFLVSTGVYYIGWLILFCEILRHIL